MKAECEVDGSRKIYDCCNTGHPWPHLISRQPIAGDTKKHDWHSRKQFISMCQSEVECGVCGNDNEINFPPFVCTF